MNSTINNDFGKKMYKSMNDIDDYMEYRYTSDSVEDFIITVKNFIPDNITELYFSEENHSNVNILYYNALMLIQNKVNIYSGQYLKELRNELYSIIDILLINLAQ